MTSTMFERSTETSKYHNDNNIYTRAGRRFELGDELDLTTNLDRSKIKLEDELSYGTN